MKTLLLHACALLALAASASAEIIGVEQFDYPDGIIAGHSGGTFWDYKNFAPTGHDATASDWDNFTGAPVVTNGRLVTDNSSAKREYNGPGEGFPPSDEADGAVNDPASVPSSVAKTVYYRVTFTTGATLPSFISVSSSDFGTDIVSFGVSMDQPNDNKFSFRIHPLSFIFNSGTLAAPNTNYTLVTKLDYANNVASLYLNPDLNAAEGSVPPLLTTSNFTATHWSTAVRLASGTGGAVTWDDLVVATTWDDLGTVVTTTADTDDGSLNPALGGGVSLREAVNHSPVGSLITFGPALSGQTITLGGTQLVVAKSLTIDASSLPLGITVDGNRASRLFDVNSGIAGTLKSLTLTGGNSTSTGGAIRNAGSLTIIHCTLAGNTAVNHGGAILNGHLLTLTGCTLTDNQGAGGAALSDVNGDETFVISQCTIAGNRSRIAATGGGLDFYRTTSATLSHTILSGNTAGGVLKNYGTAVGVGPLPPLISGGHNLSDDAPSGLTAGSDLTNNPNIKLSPLGYFGGPTMTMHPLIGSAAIDAGGTTNPGGTDQRGFPRFRDGDDSGTAQLDIGAVEAGETYRVDTAADPGGLRTILTLAYSAPHPGVRVIFNPATFAVANAPAITLSGTELAVPAGESIFIDASNIPAGVTLSGNNASRVFNITNGASVAMHGVVIANGKAADGNDNPSGTGGPGANGGGILNSGTLSLLSCTVTGNRAGDGGAGSSFGTVGGAAGAGGGIFSSGALVLVSSTVRGNQAGNGASDYYGSPGGDGGGIYVSAAARLISCSIAGNHTGNGGPGSYGANGGQGGGIFSGQPLSLTGCSIIRNQTGNGSDGAPPGKGGDGGGIFHQSSLSLTTCTVAGNRTGAGGFFFAQAPGGGGGGLFSGGPLALRTSTVSGNAASSGGGIAANSSTALTLQHSIVAQNTAPSGGTDIFDGAVTYQNANFIGTTAGIGSATGPAPLTGDAKLAPLSDYGGPTFTCLPLPGSPAINAATGSTATTDQRGQPMNGTPDLGAVEAQADLVGFVDTDSDGMDDRLEVLYGFIVGVQDGHLDADGDGSSNRDELGNKTGPRDPASVFKILTFSRTGNNINVTWTSFPGLSYTLEYGNTLGFGSTVGLGTATGMTLGNTIGPFTGPASFFRIRRN